jgi:hypothetical protein
VYYSMRLGGPFYSPKEARSRWSSIWKAIVAFCPRAHQTIRCTTGQGTVRDFLPFLAKSTVAATAPMAHRIVWCVLPTVGEVHASPADCAADRWRGRGSLTGQSGGTPDRLANYSHEALNFSREWHVRLGSHLGHRMVSGAHRTVRCTSS